MLLLLVFGVSGAGAAWWLSSREQPNTSHVTPSYMASPAPLMVGGEWTGAYARGEGEGLLLPLEVGQRLVGEGLYYEKATESVILTTDDRVVHFRLGEKDATANGDPFTLKFAAVQQDGVVYVPMAPLRELFGFTAEQAADTGILTLLEPGQAIQRAEVPQTAEEDVQLREGPDDAYAIVQDLAPGTELRIWGEKDGWYRAQSASGHIGYLDKTDAALLGVEKLPDTTDDETASFTAWKAAGERINLTWEAVYANPANPEKIGDLPGVNVVSPTWFELTDGKGTIRSKADASYTAYYRAKGVQVWGLFSNGFEPDRTEQALSTYDTRLRMIRQMLAYAKTFQLQGINLDFENVKTSDKDQLVQFVRELTPLAHEMNLVVSIDVTPKSNSEFWSLFLDRARLGQTVDYMMVMAYDEHWASSPVAGSVSSLGWSESAVRRILEEDKVPARKLILGLPLYTRMWTEKPNGSGGVKVTSKTMSMNAVAALLKDKKLQPTLSETGQHYVEFKDGDVTQKIWIEDAVSVEARMKLAKKYGLAGVASWARSFGSSDIWEVLDRHLQSRP